jgi:hypothetical protein
MLRRQPKADDVFHVLHARSLHLSRAVVRNFLWALENIEESFGSIDFGRDLASSLRGSQLPTPLWSPASRPKPLAPLATPDALKSAMEEGIGKGQRNMKGTGQKEKFPLGRTVITANAQNRLNPFDVLAGLARHSRGDWGEICKDDAQENELSLREGFRLLSAYEDRNKTKFWIITEARPERDNGAFARGLLRTTSRV